ncbi:Predicted arabinose efflux permease, MFS family [Micromonospora pattaloongensis]|uniref:Predicted arabinose efflux permease, MFS family n=1 Tax=Micromonospora pattaloongensis TaxID=405436 RepID=A0A1H3JDQ7_9ACTN|nr:MFS transporter [Micromonospora pattaloongensis]SDY38123.1 Predicted arabinose efflux permease, MFS family [Micromonospora pattaloongensis]
MPDTPGRARGLGALAAYVGGALGPLGGGIVAPLLPDMAASLHTTRSAAAASLTVYLAVFAGVQLVSGTLGERWGRRRTVRAAYLGYAAATLLCAIAPSLGLLLAGRALQGAANAFTTPLLIAGLAELVPAARLSRAVGTYASWQAAGLSLAPLVGGLFGEFSWRVAFVVVAVVSGLLALVPPPGGARAAVRPRWRALLSGRLGLLSIASFASFAGSNGLPFLVALYARDRFGTGPAQAGAVIVGFGLAGIALGPLWGSVAGRIGARRAAALGAVAVAPLVAAVGVTGHPVVLAVVWTATGAAASLLTVALQRLALDAVPDNRGGAVSVASALRFTGSAAAPLLWLPIYQRQHGAGFLAAAAVVLAVLPCVALLRDPAPPPPD